MWVSLPSRLRSRDLRTPGLLDLLLSEECSLGLVYVQFLLVPVVVHLPNFGSQREEPCEKYKNRK